MQPHPSLPPEQREQETRAAHGQETPGDQEHVATGVWASAPGLDTASTLLPPPRPGGQPDPEDPLPRPFGRYVLRERLGRGGMATVYRAYDSRLDIEVALKIPKEQVRSSPDLRERFLREAQTAARLHHPNLCRVFDVGEVGGVCYLTMGLVEGGPLPVRPPAEPAAVAPLVRKLALALAEAHARHVVHRDLKPGNVLLTSQGEPVITDFGLALRLNDPRERLTASGTPLGTLAYTPPEQLTGNTDAHGPACDVYSLGVVLFQLLTGELPFTDWGRLPTQVLYEPPPDPSSLRPGLDPRFDGVCRKALAKQPADRFPDMRAFAAALEELLPAENAPTPVVPCAAGPAVPAGRPLVRPEAVHFAFAALGERAPPALEGRDRLYLDVGNDLRAGVIDHHQQASGAASTTRLVLQRPDCLDGALNPRRRPDDRFTLVLHERPDLDCLAAAYLATAYLTTGAFPDGAAPLARYVDKVDAGQFGMSLADPFSLYASCMQLADRLQRQPGLNEAERWQETVRRGLAVIEYVLAQVREAGTPLPAVDAFACPGQFGPEDRQAVRDDIARYERKLADPRCHARRAMLRLHSEYGGTLAVAGLLVRDVQNAADPDRCVFFKDWARTDAARVGNGRGFVALSVFHTEGPGQPRRCILSVTPESGVSLAGLGALLDRAEAERRLKMYGVDDRVSDPATGSSRTPRVGYANADPWYDGRAHGYTIVDAPRAGTVITANEVERIFLTYGGCEREPEPLA